MIEVLGLVVITYILLFLILLVIFPRNLILAKNLCILVIIIAILTFGYLLGSEIEGLL